MLACIQTISTVRTNKLVLVPISPGARSMLHGHFLCVQRLQIKALGICQNIGNKHPTSDLHNQTKTATLATGRETHLIVKVVAYSRDTTYVFKATRNAIITHSVSTAASYCLTDVSYLRHCTSGTTPIIPHSVSTTASYCMTDVSYLR